MMNIHKLQADINKYTWLEASNRNYDLFHNMIGQKVKEKWEKLLLSPIIENGNELLPLGDYPHFEVPIISERAYNILDPHIGNFVELLDVKISGSTDNYFALNVINVLDCLDLEKSKIKWFKNSSKIMRITKYVFKDIESESSFILRPLHYQKTILVNEKLIQIIESNQLEGFKFEDVSIEEENPFDKLFKN